MRFVSHAVLLLAVTVAQFSDRSNASDDPSPAKQPETPKKQTPAPKEEGTYNAPPKGAVLVSLGRFVGRVIKGSDGKSFSMEVDPGTGKKEIEINLAAYTKVRVVKHAEFDDKGNPKRSAPTSSVGGPEDIRAGTIAVVNLSGTRDGKWLVAKQVTLSPE